MFAHIRMAWFCLAVLWSQKKISCLDCLRLWIKSINFYACLLGFTDKECLFNQLRSAMVCAFLSAVYDYETDWQPISASDDSLFLKLLNRYVENRITTQKFSELFLTDLGGKLSNDGLERGSESFRFCCSVIGSKWLAEYSEAELNEFGRLLQQIDDLLDVAEDRKYGHINCFLTEKSGCYMDEVRTFLLSDFFQKLVYHSRIYTLIRWQIRLLILFHKQ